MMQSNLLVTALEYDRVSTEVVRYQKCLWNAKQLKKRGYKLFQLLVFFSFVGDQMQTSTRPSLVTCNVNSLKAFETLIDENVTDIVFFIVC